MIGRLLRGHWPSLTAAVMCLEDSIDDALVEDAEAQLAAGLQEVADAIASGRPRHSIPYLFARVRGPQHLSHLLDRLGPLSHELDGVVMPKASVGGMERFLAIARLAQEGRDRPLWAMPILEGPEIAHRERRLDTLLGLQNLIAGHRDLVPCVRVGATDLSGLWGLRRTRDFTIYDVAAVADVVADVVNIFGREGGVPAISGPVWEYIHDEHVFKPWLRE